jgi:hypothetical protein
VLEGAHVGLHPRHVHAGLVGEGVSADVGPIGVGRQVAELVEEMGGLGQAPQAIRRHAVVAHLQLERRKDRDQVRVAAPLAVAVHRPLHQARPGFHRGERVGHRALGVVVGVDTDLCPIPQRLDHSGGRLRHLGRQAGAVGVAEGDVLGAGRDRRPQAVERVAGILTPGVEEVLGVVDDALAMRR